jgi:hypothetical protein
MIKGFLNLPWFLWAVLAFIVAVIYAFLGPPKEVATLTGFRFFILRWGHALVWILLTVNFVLRGMDPSLNGLASLFALAGGLIYLLFIVMTFVVK